MRVIVPGPVRRMDVVVMMIVGMILTMLMMMMAMGMGRMGMMAHDGPQ
jgi:hypothetical protein